MPSTTWTALIAPSAISSASTSVSTSTSASTTGDAFVQDTFSNGAQDTPISSRAGELGATWTQLSAFGPSVVVISSAHRARDNSASPAGSLYYASGIPPTADYRVIGTITKMSALPTAVFDVLARVTTVGETRYGARYSTFGTPGWALYKIVSGSGSALGAQFNETIASDGSRQVTLEVNGTSIKLFVDGVERVSVTDSAITLAGRVGIGGANISGSGIDTTGLALDNLTAETLSSIVTTTSIVTTYTGISPWVTLSGASTAWNARSGTSTQWGALT